MRIIAVEQLSEWFLTLTNLDDINQSIQHSEEGLGVEPSVVLFPCEIKVFKIWVRIKNFIRYLMLTNKT